MADNQYVTSTTTNLPEYAKPSFLKLMGAAEGETIGSTYTPYGGQRIADFTPAQQWAMNNQMGATGPSQFGDATALAQTAGLASLQAGQYDPSQFNAQQVGLPQLQNYQMGGPESWNAQAQQQYMSPYMQGVVDIQKNAAMTDAKKSQLAEDLGASRQGTYGGSRALLASLGRERSLGQQMGDIQAKGLQSAYESALGQFNTESAAKQAAQGKNLQSMLDVQALGSGQSMQAALANQQQDLEAQRLAEQSKQFGASNQLAAAGQAGNQAQTLGNIGQMQFNTDQALREKQLQTATLDQALQQQHLDQQYQDFLRQQQYPLEMLQQFSSVLRGVPVTPNTQTVQTQPNPSLSSQILGLGAGALGAYNAVKGT